MVINMYKYALVNTKTNIVDNTVMWDGGPDWTCPAGYEAINIENTIAGIGYSYANGVFTAPVEVPVTVVQPTAEQLQAQLTALQAQIAALTPKS